MQKVQFRLTYITQMRSFLSSLVSGDAMLELIRMSSNMADGNQQKHLLLSFVTLREFTPRGTHKH